MECRKLFIINANHTYKTNLKFFVVLYLVPQCQLEAKTLEPIFECMILPN